MHVFYTSPWVPPEWIKAHGLDPRGVWFANELGSEPLSLGAGVCTFASSVVRFAERHPDSAVIFSTHCDQLRRAFDVVGRVPSHGAVAPAERQFLFNLPATWQSPAAWHVFTFELERLGRFLVRLGGHTPSLEELAEAVNQYGLARKRLLEAAPYASGREYAEAIARFHWEGAIMLPPTRADNGSIPLALVGGPLPRAQWHVLDVIERAGGRVVLNATEAGERSLWYATTVPTTPGADGRLQPFRALVTATPRDLARLCLDKCADVFQRPNTPLYAWLRTRLAARQVRGIVLWYYVGCDLWRAEVQPLREAFGLPVLLLEASETAAELPRQAGRIEAFVESLRGQAA